MSDWEDDDQQRSRARGTRSAAPAHASRNGAWVYAGVGLGVGLLIAVGLFVWQRVVLVSEKTALERRLAASETSGTLAGEQLASLQERVAGAEASMAVLAADNLKLSADLTSATAALDAANTKLMEAAKTLTVTERTVSPTSVEKGKPLVLEVKVKGKADKVQMKLVGTSPLSFSQTYTLSKVATGSSVETWRKTITAPTGVGVYRYYATAFIGSKSFEMPGVSAWSFEVKATP
jgi:hypothetical protein